MRSLLLVAIVGLLAGQSIPVTATIDHKPFTALLAQYVDTNGNIAYDRWRSNAADVAALDAYLQTLAAKPTQIATGSDRHATLINAYNALTIRMVLRDPPKRSFWDAKPFKKKIHVVGGQQVSLDEIEHQALRPELGYPVHVALVCAARSCPKLLQRAYTAESLANDLQVGLATWLADPQHNRYDAGKKAVQVSKLFEWFAGDFEAAGGIGAILKKHGPAAHRDWVMGATVSYLEYDTSLNAQ